MGRRFRFMIFGLIIGVFISAVWVLFIQRFNYFGIDFFHFFEFDVFRGFYSKDLFIQYYWNSIFYYTLFFTIVCGIIGFIYGSLTKDTINIYFTNRDRKIKKLIVVIISAIICVLAIAYYVNDLRELLDIFGERLH